MVPDAGCFGRVDASAAGLYGLRPVPTSLSRPFGFNPLTPLRLRRCALALASRGKPCGYPRRASLAPLDAAEPAVPDRPAGQRHARWTRHGWCAEACCGRLCKCMPSSTLVVLAHHVKQDGSRTSRPASLWSFHATPQDRCRKVRQELSRLSSGG